MREDVLTPAKALPCNSRDVVQRQQPRLVFCNTSLTYPDGTFALCDVSLEIPQGEFVALIGPSGCGKSTLLRVASGLLEPSSGEVRCDRASVGYVFQDPTLLPWRSVKKNVELFAELHGVPRPERAQRAREALELVGLAAAADKYPKALSGGMRSRVSVARSLILHPKLFLFDEPFAAVDEITRERLNDEIIRLFGIEGFAATFVTHSITEACYLASRVIVMSAAPGRVYAQVHVPFPYPRLPEIRFDSAFVDIAREVAARLREGNKG
ncbi:MAG: ABC transporter ATP-binding protein [Actinobacteria bacterium]|nr:ABC transporter ATP-binding protein [Actinomycetota bacterium]